MENAPAIKYHRHRSHTVDKAVTATMCAEGALDTTMTTTTASRPGNLCGYDSYLHATICAGGSQSPPQATLVSSTPPNMGVATPFRKKCNQKLIKSRMRQQQQFLAAQHHQQQQQLIAVDQQQQQQQHREHQRKIRKTMRLMRSKSKEALVSLAKEKVDVVENLLATDNFLDKLKISEEIAEKFVECSKSSDDAATPAKIASKRVALKNELILEYASIPIAAEAGECENLISSNSFNNSNSFGNASNNKSQSAAITPNNEDLLGLLLLDSSSSSNNNAAGQQQQQLKSSSTTSTPTASNSPSSPQHSTPKSVNSTSSSAASTVHRYVHEHIHHHYHHFVNEENII